MCTKSATLCKSLPRQPCSYAYRHTRTSTHAACVWWFQVKFSIGLVKQSLECCSALVKCGSHSPLFAHPTPLPTPAYVQSTSSILSITPLVSWSRSHTALKRETLPSKRETAPQTNSDTSISPTQTTRSQTSPAHAATARVSRSQTTRHNRKKTAI